MLSKATTIPELTKAAMSGASLATVPEVSLFLKATLLPRNPQMV